MNTNNLCCVVYLDHVSYCYVEAQKCFVGTLKQCYKYIDTKVNQFYYGICNDFEGDTINADYVQCYNLD
jgi:hypothetical protein